MTENWIKQTVRTLLEQATDAVARLNFEEAQELVRTAQKIDPEEPQLPEITKIIQSLIESQQPASQDSLSTTEGTAEDSHELIPQPITPEQSSPPPPENVDPTYSDILTPDDPTTVDTSEQGASLEDDATNRVAVPGWRMGIDFGTSNTRIALNVPGQPPKILKIGQGIGEQEYMMPSVIAFHRQDGSIAAVVGEDALQLQENPDWAVVRHIKRLLVVESDPQDAEHLKRVFSEVRKKFKFLNELPKRQTAQSVARLIVAEALKRGQDEIDMTHKLDNAEPLLDLKKLPVTLGVWGSAGLEARKTAGELLSESTNASERPICDFEPCLAAQSSIKYDPDGSVGITAIFDLGGGTFDVCVVQVDEEQEISMLSAGSHPLAGGADIEQNIFNLAGKKIAEEVEIETNDVLSFIQEDSITQGSLESQVQVIVDGHSRYVEDQKIMLNDFLGRTVSIELSYDEIAASVEATQIEQGGNLISEVIEEFQHCVLRARNNIRDSDTEMTTKFDKVIEEGFIDRLILIGGGSRFPEIEAAVRMAVQGTKDNTVQSDHDIGAGINPFFAIVRGAAQTDAKSRTAVFDRPSFSLHINGREVYPAFTSTTWHSPNRLGSGIRLRPFKLNQNLSPGWEAKIVSETGDLVAAKISQERMTGPINVSFTRYGQFKIDDSATNRTEEIDLPDEYLSKRQLGIRGEKIGRQREANLNAASRLRKNLETTQYNY